MNNGDYGDGKIGNKKDYIYDNFPLAKMDKYSIKL